MQNGRPLPPLQVTMTRISASFSSLIYLHFLLLMVFIVCILQKASRKIKCAHDSWPEQLHFRHVCHQWAIFRNRNIYYKPNTFWQLLKWTIIYWEQLCVLLSSLEAPMREFSYHSLAARWAKLQPMLDPGITVTFSCQLVFLIILISFLNSIIGYTQYKTWKSHRHKRKIQTIYVWSVYQVFLSPLL